MADRLGLTEARAIVEAILAEAEKRALNFSVAVVDAGGELIHMSRMDGALALNARMCFNKAYTTAKLRRDTKVLKERMFDPSLGDERREVAWFCDPLFAPAWGSIVLWSNDGKTALGALGESGGTYQQDEEIGQLGAKVFKEL
jgi:glc operon protein GlcG